MFDANLNLNPNMKIGKDSAIQVTNVIKELVCFFQGHYVDYSIVVSSKHKAIRKSLEDGADEDTLFSLAKDILVYAGKEVDNAHRQSIISLKKYYDITGRKTNDCEVRICIKAKQGDCIFDVYRGKDKDREWSAYSIKENTGFFYTDENGDFFIENNIPQAVKEGRYKNKRIDKNLVTHYNPPSFWSRNVNKIKKSCDDPEWGKCWDVGKSRISKKESFYKSTLIVPMTLVNQKLTSVCQSKLGMNENFKKHTFGFLCFDHRNLSFFDKQMDVDIGYIVADWLSLYIVDRINYFERSEVWSSLKEKIDNEKLKLELENLEPTLPKSVN